MKRSPLMLILVPVAFNRMPWPSILLSPTRAVTVRVFPSCQLNKGDVRICFDCGGKHGLSLSCRPSVRKSTGHQHFIHDALQLTPGPPRPGSGIGFGRQTSFELKALRLGFLLDGGLPEQGMLGAVRVFQDNGQ